MDWTRLYLFGIEVVQAIRLRALVRHCVAVLLCSHCFSLHSFGKYIPLNSITSQTLARTSVSGVIRVKARLERCEIGDSRRAVRNRGKEGHFIFSPLLSLCHLTYYSMVELSGRGLTWDGLTSLSGGGRKYLPLSSFILPYKPTKLLANVFVGKPLPHEFVKGERV